MYINIAVASKNYPMEWSTLNENEKIYWNNMPMISYYRDGTFHHKLKSNELETANHILSWVIPPIKSPFLITNKPPIRRWLISAVIT